MLLSSPTQLSVGCSPTWRSSDTRGGGPATLRCPGLGHITVTNGVLHRTVRTEAVWARGWRMG